MHANNYRHGQTHAVRHVFAADRWPAGALEILLDEIGKGRERPENLQVSGKIILSPAQCPGVVTSRQHALTPLSGQIGRELVGEEIHLYFSYPEQISDPGLLRRYESLLSADELARMSRFYFARNRHQYLVTRALVRTSLSAYYPIHPSAWRFGKNRFGKPEIRHPATNLTIRFNLSHTRGLTVCAVANDCEIGVDVEDCQRSAGAGFHRLSSYFSPQETADLCKLPEDQQQQRFFDYWTLKESYIKARGKGLAIPLNKFSFMFQANKLVGFDVHPDLQDEAACWRFWRIRLADRYRIALAVKPRGDGSKVTAVNSVPLQSNVTVPLNFV